MFAPHAVSRFTLTALALAVLGCGGDSSGPSTFDPAGTSADLAALQAPLNSSVIASFGFALNGVADASGGGVKRLSPLGLLAAGGEPAALPARALAVAREAIAALAPSRPAELALSAAIPDSLLGTTLVYDESQGRYLVSNRAGAPGTGVRFVLYTVEPATSSPALPLNEIGYLDVTDQSAGATDALRLALVSDNVTYLDYTVSVTPSAGGGTVGLTGFITDGTTRVNFDSNNEVTIGASASTVAEDFQFEVPSRSLTVGSTFSVTANQDNSGSVALDINVEGSNGAIALQGSTDVTAQGVASGQYTVRVNGSQYATITTTTNTTTVTGQNGQPLTADEQQALTDVLNTAADATDAFGVLLEPVNTSFS